MAVTNPTDQATYRKNLLNLLEEVANKSSNLDRQHAQDLAKLIKSGAAVLDFPPAAA